MARSLSCLAVPSCLAAYNLTQSNERMERQPPLQQRGRHGRPYGGRGADIPSQTLSDLVGRQHLADGVDLLIDEGPRLSPRR